MDTHDQTPEQKTHRFRRWHDGRGELSESMDLLPELPQDMRSFVAEGITFKAQTDYDAEAILKSLKALGKEKTMGLYQAQNRRREYDKDPDLFRIVNCFFVLPETSQDSLAKIFLPFVDMLVEYAAACDTFGLTPEIEHMIAIRNMALQGQPDAAKTYLETLLAPQYALLLQDEEDKHPGEQTIVATEDGLKLRESD